MEESAPKRRRTSPRLASDATREQIPQSSPRRKRPSFASPTKSSMARFNPSILERRASESLSKSPERNAYRAQNTSATNRNSDLSTRFDAPGLSAAPRRSLRPTPEAEDLNPFLGRVLRRSPQTGIPIPPPPEPELPPSVPDAVSSTPPRGIHSSSPSRWRNKERKTASVPKTSSPLKRPPSRPGEDTQSFFMRKPQKVGPVRTRPEAYVRNIAPFDPLAKKKHERDELKTQLEELQRDLKVVRRENDRIRVMQAAGRRVAFTDEDATLDIVRRYLLPHDEAQPAQSLVLAKAALDPFALMSFGKPAAPLMEEEEEDDYANIRSHHPVVMKAAEELPFLQLFTPFNITANITTLPHEADENIQQHFDITLRSRHNPGLFTSKLAVTVSTLSLSIISLSLPSLEPTAKAELFPFLDAICKGECNRSLQKNCGVIVWAMGEWLRVSEQRARFWARLEEGTRDEEMLVERSRNARVRRREKEQRKDEGVKMVDLVRFMGRQTFEIRIKEGVRVRLRWRVGFDWTGEAQSRVGVMVGLPGKWHKIDHKGALGKLPSLFESLVEGGEDVSVVVDKVVALLVGE